MKAYRLGLYEKSMPNTLSFKEKLEVTKSCGFDFIELSIDESNEKLARLDFTLDEINQMKQDIKEVGIQIGSICLSGHRKYPLGSLDQHKKFKSLEIMEKAIKLAYQLGIRYIQIAGYDTYYGTSNDQTKKEFLINLKKSVDMASVYGIILAFETMETDFMNTTEKAMYYVNLLNSPYLKVYPDVGNITNAFEANHIDVVKDLNKGKGHIVAAHLKETKPGHFRNLDFGTGHTDYQACISALVNQGVKLFVGEFWFLGEENWKEKIIQANQFLKNHIEEVIKK
jgi:L-ribulose-5-phosphate 3-epimerase